MELAGLLLLHALDGSLRLSLQLEDPGQNRDQHLLVLPLALLVLSTGLECVEKGGELLNEVVGRIE